MRTGLCSVTFRNKDAEEVIELAHRAALHGIEWGGDVHVPPDTPLRRVQQIRRRTEEAGLSVASYGSYYFVLETERKNEHPFGKVMDIAECLGTNTIRIWSGGGHSKDASEFIFREAAERTIELAEAARERNLTLAFEFHRGGLTDTVESVMRLLNLIGQANVKCYYQTDQARNPAEAVCAIERLLPSLRNIHCFYYQEGKHRLLEEGRHYWQPITQTLAAAGFDGYLLMEFVKDNAEENFLRDASFLRQLVNEMAGNR